MSLFDGLKSMFGGKKAAPAGGAKPGVVRRPNKSVYDEARKVPVPDWAQGLNNTAVVAELRNHVKCKFAPNFGWKRIMTNQVGPDGNLLPEYDGIAGDCGAVKNFSLKVAQRDGRTMPYKYVDLNMAFRCCCDVPGKCPFFVQAQIEAESVALRRN